MAQARTPRCETRRDGCAVSTAELAPRLRRYVDQWNRDHRDLAGQNGTRKNARGQFTGSDSVGAISIIHDRTRSPAIDPTERGIPKSTIRSVLSQQRGLTELRIADALLIATEQPFALVDGSVNVVPNPRARAADRAACCGGSDYGDMVALLGVLSS